jgi:hypothetical protein
VVASGITVISVPYHVGVRAVDVGLGPLALHRTGMVDRLARIGVDCSVEEGEPIDAFEGEDAASSCCGGSRSGSPPPVRMDASRWCWPATA